MIDEAATITRAISGRLKEERRIVMKAFPVSAVGLTTDPAACTKFHLKPL
jgi:hypothetical protein